MAFDETKRNPTQKCPICEKWVNPLSTHLLNHHRHLLWNHLDEIKIDLEIEPVWPLKLFKSLKVS